MHWSIAILLAIQIGLGLVSDQLEWEAARPILALHVQLGLILLGLAALRLAWRLSHPPPPLPEEFSPRHRGLAQAVHLTLYALLFILPVSGFVLWMWLAEPVRFLGGPLIPLADMSGVSESWRSLVGYVHEYGFYLLALLLTLHIGAALAHELRGAYRPIRDRMS